MHELGMEMMNQGQARRAEKLFKGAKGVQFFYRAPESTMSA